jgi:prepilin-type N-terminal cleavage/methylation domain-containing protein
MERNMLPLALPYHCRRHSFPALSIRSIPRPEAVWLHTKIKRHPCRGGEDFTLFEGFGRKQMNAKSFPKPAERGFTMIEMMVVMTIFIVIAGLAIPKYLTLQSSIRIAGDNRSLAGLTAQAKLRAASDFTHARVYANLNGNTFQMQVWNKTGGCWVADTDYSNTCLTYTSGAPSGEVVNLSRGDTFGFGNLTAGPTVAQTTIAQAAQCLDNSGTAIANTACIVFNSRGIPIDANLAPLATGAFYVTNATVVDGVTVSATGSLQTWSASANASNSSWYSQ